MRRRKERRRSGGFARGGDNLRVEDRRDSYRGRSVDRADAIWRRRKEGVEWRVVVVPVVAVVVLIYLANLEAQWRRSRNVATAPLDTLPRLTASEQV